MRSISSFVVAPAAASVAALLGLDHGQGTFQRTSMT